MGNNWFIRIASDSVRISRNIKRLEELKNTVHELADFCLASQGGSYQMLKELLQHRLVLGRPLIHSKLQEALIGENNQKVALDAPTRFQRILHESEILINSEINKEYKALRQSE